MNPKSAPAADLTTAIPGLKVGGAESAPVEETETGPAFVALAATASHLEQLSSIYLEQGDPADALAVLNVSTVAYRTASACIDHSDQELVSDLVDAHQELAMLFLDSEDTESACEAMGVALDVVRLHHENHGPTPVTKRLLAVTLCRLHALHAANDDQDSALAATKEALELVSAPEGNGPGKEVDPLLYAKILDARGVSLCQGEQPEEGVAELNRAVNLVRACPTDDQQASQLAASLSNLAVAHLMHGNPEEAKPAVEEAVATYRELSVNDPLYLADLAQALENLSDIHQDLGDDKTALSLANEADDAWAKFEE